MPGNGATANHKPSMYLHAPQRLESTLSNARHNEGQPQTTLWFSNRHSLPNQAAVRAFSGCTGVDVMKPRARTGSVKLDPKQ